jgi:peptide/nickel transport system substrate-binding protein
VVIWFSNAVTNKPALELIQQQLKAVGIGITLKETPISELVAVQKAGNYDASWGNLTRADPDILRTQYSTALANYYRIPPTELDTLLTGQAGSADAAKRADLVTQIQKLIISKAYVVPVVELTTVLGLSPKVHDLAFDASSRLQFHDTWKG